MKSTLLAAAFAGLCIAGPATAAVDAAAGQSKSAACAGCHGADGNSANPMWPRLAGQHPGYLAKQIMDFKANEARANATMAPMVAALSEADAADLAAYYAAQEPTPNYASADAETLALGQRIYLGGNTETGVAACSSCHGPRGHGNPLAGFPALYGQHAQYTAAQLTAFKAGERRNDPKSMMRDVVKRMTKEEIEAVSQYAAGLY